MKSFLLGIIGLLLAAGASSQCNAYLNIGGIGSNVTIEFVASGAVNAQYIIEWGDGTADTSSTPFLEHNYSSDGQFVLFYTYQDLDNPNCIFSSFDSIILTGGSCNMGFDVQTIALVAALEAYSENTSIPIYTVDWGDGSPTEVGASLLHQYAEPGSYLVCVQMIDADPTLPCELFQCQNIEVVGVGSDCNVALQVDVDVQTATAVITGNGGANAEYIIDWGDGTFDFNPVVEHTYPIPAIYTVCVHYGVDGNTGCQISTCTEVNIDPFISDCFFDFVPVVTDLGVEIQVLAAGAIEPEYFFDWGDGAPGDYGVPAAHQYSGAGEYLICATYTDLSNPIACQINVCESVTVSSSSGGCDVVLTITQSGSEVLVVAEGAGAIEPTYFIDWGDNGLPLLASTGTHSYDAAGAFELCVTYSDLLNAGCSATTCETIVVANTEELSEFGDFNAWPNPVGEMLWVEYALKNPDAIQFRLLDATGRLIEETRQLQTSNEQRMIRIDFHGKPAGMYMLECITKQGRKTIRLTK